MAMRRHNGLKWDYFDEDVLPAWVAEMDFGLAPGITAALHDAVDRGLTAYFYPAVERDVERTAAKFWEERFDWSVEPGRIRHVPDVMAGVKRAIKHLTPPDSPVVIHSPVYYPFYSSVRATGRRIMQVRSPRDDQNRYSLPYDAIADAFDDGAGSIVLCNPWNPTGRVLTETELGELAEIASSRGKLIISDEIHSPIVYDGNDHVPIAQLAADHVVTVAAASKAWNIPGLKAAQIVLNSQTQCDIWDEAFPPDEVGVGTFGLIATAAAYSSGAEWFEEIRERLASNRDLLHRLLDEHLPGVEYGAIEGTYLAWLDFAAYDLPNGPFRFLLHEAKVGLTDGTPFGTGYDQFVRFNFATDEENIDEAIGRIASAVT